MSDDKKVVHLGRTDKRIEQLMPSGPEPLADALADRIADVIEAFTEEHPMSVYTIIGVLDAVKMDINLYTSIQAIAGDSE